MCSLVSELESRTGQTDRQTDSQNVRNADYTTAA